ncbi:MAG: hypothetical protein KatS3mg009_0815 [Acidimicrobiia bacterium]|nr:MAG: hypothetical protein KatS3mg009_0815 [Acidimicrobiia bacterium]
MELDLVEGMRFDKGYISPYFVTDPERMEAVLDDPYLLFGRRRSRPCRTCCPVLEKVMQSGRRCVVIAEDVEGEALATLVVNKIRGTFKSVAVKAPGFGERRKAMLQDMAILTGGQVISEEVGLKLENVTSTCSAGPARSSSPRTRPPSSRAPAPKSDVRAASTRSSTEIENTDSDYDREKLQERLAKLSGGVAVLKVGAATEVELKEKKHRIEDAVQHHEGRHRGGRRARRRRRAAAGRRPVLELAERLEGDEATGARIVAKALEAPLKQIADNAGLEGGVIVEKVERSSGASGLNAATGEYEDLRQGRRHRRRQGHPLGAAERGVDRGAVPHHRGRRRRQARGAQGRCGRRHGRHGRHGRLLVAADEDHARGGAPRRGAPLAFPAPHGVRRGVGRLGAWSRCRRRSAGACCTSTTGSTATAPSATPRPASAIVDAVASLEADGHQARVRRRPRPQGRPRRRWRSAPTSRGSTRSSGSCSPRRSSPSLSFVSLTELSEYTSTEDDERRRLEQEEGVTGHEADERLAAWRERMAHYREHRLHPRLPAKRLLCFYPMSKRREPGANWYELSFEERKRLMGGHARVGRGYAGRVLQLVTGSTGIDDWEWGVTLLADDPVALKDIVQEMRFDPVSARYAEFGPFVTGLVVPPAEACARVGLRVGGAR